MPKASRSGTIVIEVMIAEHGIDGAAQRVSQLGDKLQGRSIVAVSPAAEVPSQNAKVVFEVFQ